MCVGTQMVGKLSGEMGTCLSLIINITFIDMMLRVSWSIICGYTLFRRGKSNKRTITGIQQQ